MENRDVVSELLSPPRAVGAEVSGTSDADLMARVADGDNGAFDVLLVRHRRWVVNLAWQYAGDAAEAEDLAQEAFVRVYRARRKYPPTAEFTAYLRRVAVNLCLNEARRRRRHPTDSWSGQDDPETAADLPDVLLARAELTQRVRAAVKQLPDSQRMAVTLRRYEDLSHQEIARAMGCSVSAVESLLHRATQNLRKALGDYVQNSWAGRRFAAQTVSTTM